MLILFHFVVSPWTGRTWWTFTWSVWLPGPGFRFPTDLAIDTLPYPKRNGHIPIQPGVTRNKHVIGQWVFFIDLQWNRMLAIAKIYDRMVTNRPCFVSLPQLAQFFCAQLHICRWRTVFVWDRMSHDQNFAIMARSNIMKKTMDINTST